MSKLPNIEMAIDQNVGMGLAEKDYLKKPDETKPKIELPKSVAEGKKKRVVSQKQLDNLKKAREASVVKRKLIREEKEAEKIKLKAEKKKTDLPKIAEEEVDDNESRASTPEHLVDMDSVTGGHSFNYDKVISGVFDLIQTDKENRKPEKEAKWNKRFKDQEEVRIDERNKLLELVKQMEEADTLKAKKPPKKTKPKVNPTNMLRNGEPDWESCFVPRRGGNNFF
tara:strand:+ start:78 stop:752 length:675 start_codon:yes stop_codon:yes gene_type:complete